MKTLTSNVAAKSLLQGASPRFFVRIADADLFLATKTQTDSGTSEAFVDSIEKLGAIRESMDWLGGIGSVSGLNMSNLELGQRLTLCTEADLTPKWTSQGSNLIYGAGRIVKDGAADGESPSAWADVRDATSGSFATPAVVVGRSYNSGSDIDSLYRGYAQFDIPAGITTCEEAVLELTGLGDYSTTDFDLYLVQGNYTTLDGGVFNDFSGWAASGAYTATVLNETWNSAEYSATTNRFRLNATGRALVVSLTGSTLKLILLSKKDDDDDAAPSGSEWVQFETTSAVLALRYNSKKLDNKEAAIYLDYETVATTYTGMQLVRSFLVDDFSVTDRTLDLKLKDNNFKHNPTVPSTLINKTDWPSCPDNNVGKPYPVVYGGMFQGAKQHIAGIGSEFSGAAVNPLSGVRDYAPSPVVNQGDQDYNEPMEILVSKTTSLKGSLQGFLALYNSSGKAFTRLFGLAGSDIVNTASTSVKVYPKSSANQAINDAFPTDINAYDVDFFGEAISLVPCGYYNYVDVTSPSNCIAATGDASTVLSDSTSWVEYQFNSAVSSGTVKRAEVTFYLNDSNSGTPYNELKVIVKNKPVDFRIPIDKSDGVSAAVNATTSKFSSASTNFGSYSVAAEDYLVIIGGDNDGRYRIKTVGSPTANDITVEKMPDDTETAQSFKVLASEAALKTVDSIRGTGTKVANITTLDAGDTIDTDFNSKIIRIEVSAGHSPVDNFSIYNLQVRIYTAADNIETVWLDKRGVKDDGSGTITGTASLLIENPSHVIESMARDEMGLAAASINTTAFDTAATELTGWELAFQIDTQKPVTTWLDSLAKQSRSRVFWDYNDDIKMVAFNGDAYYSVSGTDIPSGLDIFDSTGSPTGGSFTTNPILPDSLSIGRVSLDDVFNDFKLRYRKNYASGEFAGVLYMDNGLGTAGSVATNITEGYLENSQTLAALKALTAASYTAYGSTRSLTFDADMIRDEATASKLLQYLIERTTTRKYTVTLRTLFTAIGHELGDIINVQDSRLNDLFGEATTLRKKWEIIEMETDLDNCEIEITAVEV